jgi:uncharacterized protein with FMN-binding domain
MRRGVVATGTTASAVALVFSFAASNHRPDSAAATAPVATNAASVASVSVPTATATPRVKATHKASPTASATASPTATATATARATATAKATTAPKVAATTAPAAPAAPAPAAPAPAAPAAPAGVSGTFTGGTAQTAYGPVQVQIVVQNNTITSANAIKYPTGNSHDIAIAQYAVPVLNREAVQAQSANISMVSGATYTSSGYIQSLQSALSAAHL